MESRELLPCRHSAHQGIWSRRAVTWFAGVTITVVSYHDNSRFSLSVRVQPYHHRTCVAPKHSLPLLKSQQLCPKETLLSTPHARNLVRERSYVPAHQIQDLKRATHNYEPRSKGQGHQCRSCRATPNIPVGGNGRDRGVLRRMKVSRSMRSSAEGWLDLS